MKRLSGTEAEKVAGLLLSIPAGDGDDGPDPTGDREPLIRSAVCPCVANPTWAELMAGVCPEPDWTDPLLPANPEAAEDAARGGNCMACADHAIDVALVLDRS